MADNESPAIDDLSVTRFIDAPPETVWDVMANRQEEWWCPAPWRVRIDRQERRAGGACDMTVLGPNGEEMEQRGLYLAWDEGSGWVTTDAVTAGFEPAEPFMIGIWRIEPEGDGTRYTASARHWTEEKRAEHAAMGFIEGWTACADQLAVLCETQSGAER